MHGQLRKLAHGSTDSLAGSSQVSGGCPLQRSYTVLKHNMSVYVDLRKNLNRGILGTEFVQAASLAAKPSISSTNIVRAPLAHEYSMLGFEG